MEWSTDPNLEPDHEPKNEPDINLKREPDPYLAVTLGHTHSNTLYSYYYVLVPFLHTFSFTFLHAHFPSLRKKEKKEVFY